MLLSSENFSQAISLAYTTAQTRWRLLLLSASVLVAVWVLFRVIYLLYFHPLSRVPGPFLAKVSTSWQLYYASKLLKAHKVQGKNPLRAMTESLHSF
jgi:hypothetical protein